jgi:hypothetical protein
MMAIRGEIDRPDHVLFADTGWESKATYQHVEWCRKQCDKAGIPFHVTDNGNIKTDMEVAKTAASGEYSGQWVTMPLFVNTGKAVEGRIRRQCSSEYKITPLRKLQRKLLGYEKGQRIPVGQCQVMIGISTDEARRAAASKDRWIDNIYPLIDPLKMSRLDCQKWWEDNYPHIRLTKSSCVGCPNRSDREWLAMSRNTPDEFKDACAFDEKIRKVSGVVGTSFLHRSLKPLSDVDLNETQGGLDLEDDIYCAGGCGL